VATTGRCRRIPSGRPRVWRRRHARTRRRHIGAFCLFCSVTSPGPMKSGKRRLVVDLVTTGLVVFVGAILLLVISVIRRPHY
jgi:hypothetical protein